jgi:hypothetical protein
MKLLFKREQSAGKVGRVRFKLRAKVDFDEGEMEIVKRYRFDEAILIAALQPGLLRNVIIFALIAFVLFVAATTAAVGTTIGLLLGALGGVLGGVLGGAWWFTEKRETIFVRDLIHGRHFACSSVIDLASKEAYLEQIVSFLRQVMESAKNWDGTETIDIPALGKAEAKYMMLKSL